jgi:hypothetical protein
MRKNSYWLIAVLLASSAIAQVVSPLETDTRTSRRLQHQYTNDLGAIAADLSAHSFPYHFYFSRKLDIDEQQQQRLPQDSIRFERYNSETVLAISGNYYASYAASKMDRQARVKQAFSDVLLPMLRVAVPHFASSDVIGAYALEISYHVRKKVLGVEAEGPENVAVVIQREVAQKLVAARTPDEQQAAMLEASMYVDAEPFALWLSGNEPPEQPPAITRRPRRTRPETIEVASLEPMAAPAPAPTVSERLFELPPTPVHSAGPADLATLQSAHAVTLTKLRRELEAQAHFVAYAPPTFVAFKGSAYLELSIDTPVTAGGQGSRYKLAALAFDEHISHLIRPALGYFSDHPGFDGIDFSTTVKPASGTPLSVEFMLPLKTMHCFADYDCTGQQLLNGALVLINGERVTLQLDGAER